MKKYTNKIILYVDCAKKRSVVNCLIQMCYVLRITSTMNLSYEVVKTGKCPISMEKCFKQKENLYGPKKDFVLESRRKMGNLE